MTRPTRATDYAQYCSSEEGTNKIKQYQYAKSYQIEELSVLYRLGNYLINRMK